MKKYLLYRDKKMAVKSNSYNEKVRYIYVSEAKKKRFMKFFSDKTSFNQACNLALDDYMREHYNEMIAKKRREKELDKLFEGD